MQLKLDYNVLLYLFLIILLGTIALSIKFQSGVIFKIIFRMILGGLFIYLFNFIGRNFNITIPLNFITSLLVGLLEAPGLAFIFIIKYIIYP